MKTPKQFLRCAVALGAIWLAGCSTPATRIKGNPAVFARLNPEQQTLVKAGRVSLGMDESAVTLAVGKPDRVVMRNDATGETRVWRYGNYENYYGGFYPYSGWGGYGRGHHGWHGYGGYAWGYGGWGYPYGPSQAYDRLRLEFRGGVVTSINQETRR